MGARHSSLRYRIEDLAFAIAGFVLTSLPIETASWLSGSIWRFLGPRFGRRHARALANLARAYPEKTESEREAIAWNMWENLGQTFAESFHLAELAASHRVELSSPDVFATILPGKGYVICAPHQANWEIAVLATAARAKIKPAGVYQRIKNPLVDARVRKMRDFLYPGGLYAKNSQTARQLIRHAREGGAIAMLADQRDFRGLRVPFFGQLAPSTPFPAMVARTYDLKLYAGEIVRKPHVRFSIGLIEIEIPKTEDREADILSATASLQSEFERTIRKHPQQWMWSHRRWG
jgi:KDO2-lipid IV(A) lauroyltransferase